MKISFKKTLATMALTVAVSPSFAAHIDKNKAIDSISTYSTGVLIKYTTAGANSDNCTLTDANKLAFLDTTTVAGRTMLASVIAAHVSGKPITLGIRDCKAWGAGTVPKAYRVKF